jgi:hypothetical protein
MLRSRRAVLPAALLALLVAMVAGGCGGSGDDRANRYVDQVNRAQSQFAQTVTKLSGRVTDTSSAGQDRRTLRAFTAAVDGVVAALRRIKPPPRVVPLHRELVSDINSYGAEVKSAAATLSSHDAARLAAAQQRLLKATSTVSSQINATIDAINKRLQQA